MHKSSMTYSYSKGGMIVLQ